MLALSVFAIKTQHNQSVTVSSEQERKSARRQDEKNASVMHLLYDSLAVNRQF